MPSPGRFSVPLILAVVLSLPLAARADPPASACPEGELRAGGRCVAACPADGRFAEPGACECPPGFGKLLHGDGSGECSRATCPTNAPFAATLACDCPAKFERIQGRQGLATCRLRGAAKAK